MKKQVMVTPAVKKYLEKKYDCTTQAVWKALNFISNSDQAQRIRVEAYKRGGKLVEDYVPNCETSHDTANGIITQRFSDRIQVKIDRNNGDVTVIVDGKTREVYHNLTVAEYSRLQYQLEIEALKL